MKTSELVIGMPYVYRTKKGKYMVVTFTDQTYDGRYVFHTRGWKYRFVFGPDTVKDRVSESYDEHTTIDRNCI